MSDQRVKVPDDDHPISIARNGGRIIVRLGDKILADTTAALTLTEAKYAPVHYIPRADIDMSALEPSTTASYCPYKGNASYFSVRGGLGPRDVAWCYESPFPSVGEIAGRLAFYPNRVDAIEEQDPDQPG